MPELFITCENIEKLGHPIKEIRERCLLSLYSKLEYDYSFDDNFNGATQLLKLLFRWFQLEETSQSHTHQDKVLQIILSVIKSESGKFFMKHYSCKRLLQDLNNIESKVDPGNIKLFTLIVKYILEQQTALNEDSLNVPELDLPRSMESLVDVESSSNASTHYKSQIFEVKENRVEENSERINLLNLLDERKKIDLLSQGVKVYLLPWCCLCDSDMAIIKIIEDTFNMDEFTEKTANFFCNILLRDFPAELFLNRPLIANTLLKMLNSPDKCLMSLEALRSFCKAIFRKLSELKDPDLRHCKNFVEIEKCNTYRSERRININLSKSLEQSIRLHVDGDEALKQLPLPLFCLEIIYIAVNCLGEYAVQPLTANQTNISYAMREINEAISLCFDSCKILYEIINSEMWGQEHSNIFIEKVYQKTVVVMRSLGDILNRFRLSYTTSQSRGDSSFRVSYLRLLSLAIFLTRWCNYTPLIPSSFTSSLFEGLFDVSCMLLYADLHTELKNTIQNVSMTSIQDKEKTDLFKDCENIFRAMHSSVDFIQNYSTLCESPNVIKVIKTSLPALAFHLNVTFIARVMDVFSVKCLKWKQSRTVSDDMRFITLTLLAHSNETVQEAFYTMIHTLVGRILSGDGRDASYKFNEESLHFLFHSSILIEIASHGIDATSKKVQRCAKDIIQYLLRGKLLFSSKSWRLLLEALLPALTYIHVHGAHSDPFGSAVIKTLDLKISEQMLIPKIDVVWGNIRLLFTKCFTAQMEGASNLAKLLNFQDGADILLPKQDSIRAEVVCSSIRPLPPSNFNILKHSDAAFYEKSSLLQVMSLLSNSISSSDFDYGAAGDAGCSIDPTFRRSALAQLSVMLQQPTLHEPFLSNNGCKLISHYLRASLTTLEYTSFPESAMSCVNIFNIICYCNGSIRQWLSEQLDIILNIVRALLIFRNEDGFPTIVSQLLSLLAFTQVINNTPGFSSPNRRKFSGLSVHHCVAKNTNLPFPCESYSQTSAHQRYDKVDVLMGDETACRFLRISWCCAWYGNMENVVRWPYIPDNSEPNEYFSKSLMMTSEDLDIVKMTCPVEGCVSSLYQMQNATSHKAVNASLDMLKGYMLLVNDSKRGLDNFEQLPWSETLSRFIKSVPASPKDTHLLLNVIKCIITYVDMLLSNGCTNLSLVAWLDECIFNTSYGITSLLKQQDCEKNWAEEDVDQTPNNVRQAIIELICKYSVFVKQLNEVNRQYGIWKCEDFVEFLTHCLRDVEIENHYSLAFIGQILRCLSYLIGLSPLSSVSCVSFLIQYLTEILIISFIGDGYAGYKNTELVRNSLIILCHLLQDSLGNESKMKVWIENALQQNGEKSILSACLLWQSSNHIILRCLVFKLLTGLCTQPAITSHLNQNFDDANKNLMEIVVNRLTDNSEASLFREQVATLLSNLLSSKLARHLGMNLFDANFFEQISSVVTKVCLDDIEEYDSENNIPLEVLSNREALEVAYSKDEFTIPILLSSSGSPRCSIKLLTSFTDMIYNYIFYSENLPSCLVQSGILRFLFRCIALKAPLNADKFVMITAVCRLLHRAVNMSLHVHSTIVRTEDCVNALFDLYSPQYTELKTDSDGVSATLKEMWKWSLSLIGSIAETKNGFNLIWKLLLQSGLSNFFRIILLSVRDAEYKEMLASALFCFSNLLTSHILYVSDNDKINIKDILNDTPTSSLNVKSAINNSAYDLQDYNPEIINDVDEGYNAKVVKFNTKKTVLEDAVLGEDICEALLTLYKTTYSDCKNGNFTSVNENPCYSITACLCGLFAISSKAQLYGIERGFIQQQIKTLSDLHYSVAADVKASDLYKKTNHPALLQLDWIIQLLCNIMTNSPRGKDQCVNSGLVVPLNKVWPWAISTLELRQHTVQMICVYTNKCAKANQSMHTTVGARSLLQEVIDLVDKEMNLITRQRSLSVLRGCLVILENVSSHIHCRAIILKSDLLNHLNKLHPAVTKRQPQWREAESMWESLLVTLSRYPEGQLRIAEYIGTLCALIHQAQGLMLPVLGNCAFNPFNRPRILGSAEVLNIFSVILLSGANVQDMLTVCGALWALGANHHKSKLALKTAGLTTKLAECLQKLKYDSHGSVEAERAIQIMTYVLKIITIL